MHVPLPLKGGVIKNIKNQGPGGGSRTQMKPVPPGESVRHSRVGRLVIVSTKRLHDVSFH